MTGKCRYLLLLAALFLSLPAEIVHAENAKAEQSECLQWLRDFNARQAAASKPANCFLRYTVDIEGRREFHTASRKLEMRIHQHGDQMHILSDDFQIYHEEGMSISVMPRQQTLMIADRMPAEESVRLQEVNNLLRDSVMNYSRLVACRDTLLTGGQRARILQLSYGASARQRFGPSFNVRSATLLINIDEDRLQSIAMAFHEGYQLASMRVSYHEFRVSAAERPHARTLFFAGGERLKREYRSWRVRDVRRSEN